jgi:hypothetical protein
MIKHWHSTCGQRLAVLQYISRTGVPIEPWGGRLLRRPGIEHLRIFGCLTFSHVPSEKRTKLDPTTERGMLVGYSEVAKVYRIYIPTLRRVVVRRDVRFEEGRAFGRSLELRDIVEEVSQLQSDASQGTQPQVLSTSS